MATLTYGTERAARFDMDDADLGHLAAVITSKLRRREAFLLTLASDARRESIWIHGSSTIVYAYDSSEPIELDRTRLEAMAHDASKPAGLTATCRTASLRAVDSLSAA